MGSNLGGHDSHGVMRAPWYMEKIDKGEIVPGALPTIERPTPTTAIVDGHWGFGPPIARRAMELAIEKASSQNLGCVTVRNCNHVGRLGAYTTLAALARVPGTGAW